MAEKKTKDLSAHEQQFVYEYLRCNCKASKAYLRIFPNVKQSTAEVNGSRMLNKTKVKQAIDAELCRIWKEKDKESAKGNIYKRLQVIADATIDDIVDIHDGTLTVKDMADIPPEVLPAIAGIDYSETNTEGGVSRRVSVKLRDSLKAIETMAKIIKLLDPKAETQQIEIVLIPAERPSLPEADIPDSANHVKK